MGQGVCGVRASLYDRGNCLIGCTARDPYSYLALKGLPRPRLLAANQCDRSPPAQSTLMEAKDAAETPVYSLLSSTRYDDALRGMGWNTRVNGGQASALMFLPYHFDRLIAAAGDHGWSTASDTLTLAALHTACEDAVRVARETHPAGPLKVRRRRRPHSPNTD